MSHKCETEQEKQLKAAKEEARLQALQKKIDQAIKEKRALTSAEKEQLKTLEGNYKRRLQEVEEEQVKKLEEYREYVKKHKPTGTVPPDEPKVVQEFDEAFGDGWSEDDDAEEEAFTLPKKGTMKRKRPGGATATTTATQEIAEYNPKIFTIRGKPTAWVNYQERMFPATRLTYFNDWVTLKMYICMKCGCPTFCAKDYKDHKENMCIGWLKEKILEAKQKVEEHKKKEMEIEKCSESWVRIEPTKAQTYPGAPPYSFEQEEEEAAAGVEPEEKRVRYTFKPSQQKGAAHKKKELTKRFVPADANHTKKIKEMQEVLKNLEHLSPKEKNDMIKTFNTQVQGMLAELYAQQVPGVPAPDVICLLEQPDQPTTPEQPEIAASTSTAAAAAAAPTPMDVEPEQPTETEMDLELIARAAALQHLPEHSDTELKMRLKKLQEQKPLEGKEVVQVFVQSRVEATGKMFPLATSSTISLNEEPTEMNMMREELELEINQIKDMDQSKIIIKMLEKTHPNLDPDSLEFSAKFKEEKEKLQKEMHKQKQEHSLSEQSTTQESSFIFSPQPPQQHQGQGDAPMPPPPPGSTQTRSVLQEL